MTAAILPVIEDPGSLEPLMPPIGQRRLEDLAVDLVARASGLAGRLHPLLHQSIGALVRSMNCYYSNLIEGHDTHPRDIDRALAKNYSTEPKRRALQDEALAHIELQQAIDEDRDEPAHPTTAAYIRWLHREFCRRLPEEMLWVEDPDTGRRVKVVPGVLRDGDVQVGLHVPPSPAVLPSFLDRFERGYAPDGLSRLGQVIAVAAAHHRLLWIHPFYDANGRVARLMSHALLKRAGVGSSLWSISRGLARSVTRYKTLLMAADSPRSNDWDGRGNLSQAALIEFCDFFLGACIDQVGFMESLLQPSELMERMARFADEETRAGRLPAGSYPILREAALAGQVERARARQLTGYQERMARIVVSKLLEKGLLVSAGPRDLLRLGFPIDVVDRWFPRLYPGTV
jgi:Fic family protein